MKNRLRWPVAYHGTAEKNVLDILRDGLDINKCVRFAFGQGIYCSPDPKTAIQYGQNYTYHGPDGSVIVWLSNFIISTDKSYRCRDNMGTYLLYHTILDIPHQFKFTKP